VPFSIKDWRLNGHHEAEQHFTLRFGRYGQNEGEFYRSGRKEKDIAHLPARMYYSVMTTVLQELETLSVSERVELVEYLWDSIARSNAEVPIPQWQMDELNRRKRNYLQNPESGQTWDQVKREILQPL